MSGTKIIPGSKHAASFYNALYDRKADGKYAWFVLLVQAPSEMPLDVARDDTLKQNTEQLILNSLHSKSGWRRLFSFIEEADIPRAEIWSSKRPSPGKDMWWYSFKVPVPLKAFDQNDQLIDLITKGSSQGGILGIHSVSRLYFEWLPIEEFSIYTSSDKIDPLTLLPSLELCGAIQSNREENRTPVGNRISVYSTVRFIRLWAFNAQGDMEQERRSLSVWGNIIGGDGGTGTIKNLSVSEIKDYGQRTKSVDVTNELIDARSALSFSSGDMISGKVVKRMGWQTILIIIFSVIGGVATMFGLYHVYRYFTRKPSPANPGQVQGNPVYINEYGQPVQL